jgi:hypothetical protein
LKPPDLPSAARARYPWWMAETAPSIEPLEHAIRELVEGGRLRVPPYPAVAVRVQEALGRKDAGLAEIA